MHYMTPSFRPKYKPELYINKYNMRIHANIDSHLAGYPFTIQ